METSPEIGQRCKVVILKCSEILGGGSGTCCCSHFYYFELPNDRPTSGTGDQLVQLSHGQPDFQDGN